MLCIMLCDDITKEEMGMWTLGTTREEGKKREGKRRRKRGKGEGKGNETKKVGLCGGIQNNKRKNPSPFRTLLRLFTKWLKEEEE